MKLEKHSEVFSKWRIKAGRKCHFRTTMRKVTEPVQKRE